MRSSILLALLILIAIVCAARFSPTGASIGVFSATGEASYGNVTFIVSPACHIGFSRGWNLISLCAEPANLSVSSVLQNVSYRYILVWNTTRQEFDIFSPSAANPPFNSFETNKSYFILYEDATPTTVGVFGNLSDDKNISLVQKWNPPGYPYIFTSNISCYLQSIADKYRYVLKWNRATQQFLIYSPFAAEPQFTTISRGEGQFILVTDPSGALLRYNKTACET